MPGQFLALERQSPEGQLHRHGRIADDAFAMCQIGRALDEGGSIDPTVQFNVVNLIAVEFVPAIATDDAYVLGKHHRYEYARNLDGNQIPVDRLFLVRQLPFGFAGVAKPNSSFRSPLLAIGVKRRVKQACSVDDAVSKDLHDLGRLD
jgi:hypothetical protein